MKLRIHLAYMYFQVRKKIEKIQLKKSDFWINLKVIGTSVNYEFLE